ncbi:hypothetical protein [Dactylosporangium matsuzakiense]|uniref:Uncharacterized protein n=1 Tax=Dactylosporangium matsuzakiense TaxID=53360 RepID=A0A9W6NN93_9ACTN|nr:hypothetical protein [Dactylosporangium matsuzakiense]GLL03715.1 hypothetical protein GCM10017581_054610 [Dactylosporangium matsuzakiense]
MTTRLTFALDIVCRLAEQTAAAAGTGHATAVLLLQCGPGGVCLTSDAPGAALVPAGRPDLVGRPAGCAWHDSPGVTGPGPSRAVHATVEVGRHVLPLGVQAGEPLLDQLRAAGLAGATTVVVWLTDAGPLLGFGRRRVHAARRSAPLPIV